MLKFVYTDTSFHLERLAQSLEELVAARAIVAMRVGQSLCIEPTTASFLLPADLPTLRDLEVQALREDGETIAVSVADAEYVEVSLRGTWIAADQETAEGVFVTSLCDRTEFFLLKCWQDAQTLTALLKEAGD